MTANIANTILKYKEQKEKIKMNEIEKNSKIIFNPAVARSLLKNYNAHLIDIKPSKTNKAASVFVFEKNEAFDKAMQEISANKSNA